MNTSFGRSAITRLATGLHDTIFRPLQDDFDCPCCTNCVKTFRKSLDRASSGDQVVSLRAFYSDDPNSNPSDIEIIPLIYCIKRRERGSVCPFLDKTSVALHNRRWRAFNLNCFSWRQARSPLDRYRSPKWFCFDSNKYFLLANNCVFVPT